MLVGLFALVLINVPVAVALGVVAVLAVVIIQGPDMLPNVALVMFEGATNFPLLAIPLFILAGAIMNASSISQAAHRLRLRALLGFIRGGLSIVTIGSSMFFAEISGSAVAGVAALGTILIPAMRSKGYSARVCGRDLLLVLEPRHHHPALDPDDPLRGHGRAVGRARCSWPASFRASSAAFGLALAAYVIARRHDFPVEQAFSPTALWHATKEAAWAFLLPVIILGGIFGGLVTATEGAGLAVAAALFISVVIYRELDLRKLKRACIDGGVQTAVVMLLVAASALIGVFLTEAQLPQQLAHSISAITTNKYAVLALLNVFFLLLGMFLHSAAAIILVVPIVMPLVTAVGHRPDPFRPRRDLEPRHRPADAAGRERADRRLLDRQDGHLGDDQDEPRLHRRAGGRPAAVHLCAVRVAGARPPLLRCRLIGPR